MKGEEESDIVWREDREEKWMKPSRDSTLLSYHLFYLIIISPTDKYLSYVMKCIKEKKHEE